LENEPNKISEIKLEGGRIFLGHITWAISGGQNVTKKGVPKTYYCDTLLQESIFAASGMQGKAYRTVVPIVSYNIAQQRLHSWWQMFRD
jgi:hypothetical protein